MGVLPEQQPEDMQIWPFGHGIVATTVAKAGGKGMFILAGLPDALEGIPGQAMAGDPVTMIQSLIALPGNQSCVMIYPDAAAVDATIASLAELKKMMETADA